MELDHNKIVVRVQQKSEAEGLTKEQLCDLHDKMSEFMIKYNLRSIESYYKGK